jgi:hypothetical protein
MITARNDGLIAAPLAALRKRERIARPERLIASCKQAAFGWRSRKVDPDRFERSWRNPETPIAALTQPRLLRPPTEAPCRRICSGSKSGSSLTA